MLPKPIDESQKLYQLALSFVPDVGPKTARALLAKYPTAKDIFEAPLPDLKNIGNLNEQRVRAFRAPEVLKRAEEELDFCLRNNVSVLFMGEPEYPQRFMDCDDPAVVLYYKGNANLNASKTIAIIGTRKNTDYGQRLTEDLVEGLKETEDILVVSGLALGIDTLAHKASVKHRIPTIGVLGHGLDRLYPHANKTLANEMTELGGLLTEFPTETKPDRQNFPVRNRVVAGISDVTVVVESDEKGGAMITAYVAHGYNREIAAFPGRTFDSRSGGPNLLIKRNIAALITGADDLLQLMNWSSNKPKKAVQRQMFVHLSPDEQTVFDLLKDKDAVHADELLHLSKLSNSQLASVLLQMEMQGLVKALPGKMYRLD